MAEDSIYRWFRVNDAYYCFPAKCGGSAFYQWLVEREGVTAPAGRLRTIAAAFFPVFSAVDVARKYGKKYLAFRDPVDRVISLWRDKCRDGDENKAQRYLKGMTLDELIDHIAEFPFGNQHWTPQYSYMVPDCELIHFWKMGKLLGYKYKVNATKKYETDPQPNKKKIRHLFYRDACLWDSLK